jgi:ABC-type antimicrobial peptide transport system permease subunit
MQLSGAAVAGSLLTLLLSAIGLYAIVAFAVNQRRNEIGIRTALGATPGQVSSLFFGNGLRLSAIGLVLGLPLSMIGLRAFVLQTGIPRPPTLTLSVLIALTVVTISAIATWIPARRATRIDPLIALRSE